MTRRRLNLATVIAGAGFLTVAAFLVHAVLGLAVTGGVLLTVGLLADDGTRQDGRRVR